MKGVVNFYKEFGRTMKGHMAKKSQPPLAGVHPPIWQTPGKLQYYRAENEPFIPDEVKWNVRAPTRFAIRQAKLTYLQQVQEEVNNFLQANIKHDFLKPDRQLSLDLSVKEAEILASANMNVRTLAENGDLKLLHERFRIIQDRVETDYLKVRDLIDRIVQQVEEKENEIYDQAEELGVKKLQKHGQQRSFYDLLSSAVTNPSVSNLTVIISAIERGDHPNHQDLVSIRQRLHQFTSVKSQAADHQANIHSNYIKGVDSEDQAAHSEYKQLINLRDQYDAVLHQVEQQMEGEAASLLQSLQQIADSSMKDLLGAFKEYEKTHEEKSRVYHNYAQDQTSEYLDTFRSDLLQHLAGSIIVKEHRQRYQKEQYDRFFASLQNNKLKKVNQTLGEFSIQYANLIESLIDDSHNYRSPHIEANYDDFSERTVRPINATIFYYFFSADKRRRTISQWLLSAIRYPNQRVRRAYMRFFA